MRAPELILAAMITLSAVTLRAAEPDFGPNVLIIDPGAPDAQAKIDAVFAQQEKAQFGTGRSAILLKPGKHHLKIPVGFYTQVLGLGASPDDVDVVGYVRSKAFLDNGNATCNFWRAVENLAITPAGDTELEKHTNVWAVSQATGMRRVHIKGNLNLWDNGWSSGGFLADSKIDGTVTSGSQQQWLSRNTNWAKWNGGSWNMVFVGCLNAPTEPWPHKPNTVIAQTPIIREKPYLMLDNGQYAVHLPNLARDTAGTTWENGTTAGRSIPIADFYVAHADKDDAASINAALDAGKHLLFTPGTYKLAAPLKVAKANTVVMGIGYATLRTTAGTAALEIADVAGVTVAGLLVEATDKESPVLVQVGAPGSKADHTVNPIHLFDLYCRTGGEVNGRAKSLVDIHASGVVGDNLWLWRADHGEGAAWNSNTTANGIVVTGNDVTMYGLFVEHTQEYQVLWQGERGRTYFYQSEMPYDPPAQDKWMSPGNKKGYPSYKVADTVKTHEAHGLGIYSVFFAAPVVVDSPIEVPEHLESSMHHLVTVRFAGKPNSGFTHVMNDKGGDITGKERSSRIN